MEELCRIACSRLLSKRACSSVPNAAGICGQAGLAAPHTALRVPRPSSMPAARYSERGSSTALIASSELFIQFPLSAWTHKIRAWQMQTKQLTCELARDPKV